MGQKINFITDGYAAVRNSVSDPFKALESLGVDISDLINLCGGVPSEEIADLEIDITSVSEKVIKVQVITSLYQVNRTIDFGLMIIHNTYMHVFTGKQRIGTRLLCNQVAAARRAGFRKLTTIAMGGEDWSGYYCWGRLGYEMIAQDKEEFGEMMEQFGRPEKSLHELLGSEDGQVFWLAYGAAWSGEFFLDEGHKSVAILKGYLKKSSLDYEI